MPELPRQEQINKFAAVLEGVLELWKLTRSSGRDSHAKFCAEAGISTAQLSAMFTGRNLPRLDSLGTLTRYILAYFEKKGDIQNRFPMNVEEFRARFPLFDDREANRRVPIGLYLYKTLWRASGYSETPADFPEVTEVYNYLTTIDDRERKAMIDAFEKAKAEVKRKRTETNQTATVAVSIRR